MLCIGSAFTVFKAILAAAFIGTLAAAERFVADLATTFGGTSAGVSCVSRSHGKFGGGAHRYVSGLPSVSWQIWRRRSSGRQRAFPAFHGLMANLAAALIGTLAGCRAFHGRFGDGAHRYASGLPSVSWQIWRRRSSGRQRAFPAFHGLMANLAAALIGTLAGCRAFHGRFGDGVRRGVSCVSRSHGKFGGGAHRYVSGLPSVSWQIWRRRSSGRQRAFPAFHGASLQRFHWGVTSAVSLGRHFGGFIANFAAATKHFLSVVGRREHCPRPSRKRSLVPSQRPSATFSDCPYHFVTVSGRSSREHCLRDARGGACPCHVGSFPFHGLRSVY